ncbi:MAG TPA: A24 family peptidase [Candidatus Eisenbergiella merdipullorum]|uniref:A24 family peptidase n=1 Tax=Candidatus Eisenbergiella merdipullorum TaxID=2838553 RepID=A0A9D2L0K8_9FIRM|nr:A24 family peptidase [Candidatus Eisenbergiella merdipullorum]
MRIKNCIYTSLMFLLGTEAVLLRARSQGPAEAAFLTVFCLLLYAAGLTDLRLGRLPDGYAASVFLLGAASLPFFSGPALPVRLMGIFAVSLPLFLLTLLMPGAFGGGDIKLMAGCGFFLGAKAVLFSFACAVFAGGIWALFLLLSGRKKREDRFPFGPFLCAGMILALIFGK